MLLGLSIVLSKKSPTMLKPKIISLLLFVLVSLLIKNFGIILLVDSTTNFLSPLIIIDFT